MTINPSPQLLQAADEIALLTEEVTRLRSLVYNLSDCLTDEGPNWTDDWLQSLRDRTARELPEVEWLQPYRARAALPKETET